MQREALEIPSQKSHIPYKCAVWGFVVHKPQFRIYIGDSRTFLEEQWLYLGKGAAVVMRKICVALRTGARREAPPRLRVPPAQGLCLSKTGPLRRWLSSSRSAIRAGFGRQPPLWKERHTKMQFSCVFVVWRIEKAHPLFTRSNTLSLSYQEQLRR